MKKYYKGYAVFDYLKEIEGFSSRLLRNAKVYVNKKKVRPNKKLRYRDVIWVIEKEKSTNIKPIELDLDIAYEDNELLIVNKEPFLITHPTLKKVDITLANGIVYYFKNKNINMVPRFYNRLDMNTSGLIIIAKSGFAQGFLQNRGEVKKYYVTVVKGIINEDEFTIEKSIGISDDGIKREINENGQYAKTTFKALNRNCEKDVTILEAQLFTGRTHQIRVHLSSIGHPILGDTLYGGEDLRVNRQLLHSYKTIFINPETKDIQTVKSEFPADIKKFI